MTDADPLHAHHDYALGSLADRDLDPDPVRQFRLWLDDATAAGMPEPNAMVLGTIDPDGTPSSRTVLLRGVDDGPVGGFRFFTNRLSRKGVALAHVPAASILFPWYGLQRQVLVAGAVERLTPEEDDAYFASRPRLSQLAARASEQSRRIASRRALEQAMDAEAERFPDPADVPRPTHWGGYRLVPARIEFWQGRRSRLHDRLQYSRPDRDTAWTVDRLQP